MSLQSKYKSLFDKYGLTTKLRIAHFMAQIEHESGLKPIGENLNYSASGLIRVFRKYFNKTTAKLYANNPEKIANRVYANRIGNGDSYVSNITLGGTGRNYVGRNNGTETYSVDKTGNVIGNSYIKRSTPANNILLAGGGDLAQNTAFNKNFGTTSGTVVEGGTLGSNAYTSTAYLPLSGGNINGPLKITRDGFQLGLTGSDQGAIDLYKSGTLGHRLFSDAVSFGVYDLVANVSRLSISNSTGAATFASSVTATKLSVSSLAIGTQTLLELGEPGYVATNYGSVLEGSSATGLFSLFNYNTGVKSTTPVLSWNRANSNMTFGGAATFASTVTATSYASTSLPVFENNAAASSLAVGQFYRTSTGVLMVKF